MPRSGRVSRRAGAKLIGRPTLILDIGTLRGSLGGQTKERTRQALQIADGMAPRMVMIDQLEKAFAHVGNSGQADSGISSRRFGSCLSWLRAEPKEGGTKGDSHQNWRAWEVWV